MSGRSLVFFRLVLLSAGMLLGATATAMDNTEAAEHWLHRMSQAIHKMNYEGIFIYQRGNRLDTMRIIHKFDGENEIERLVSLTGNQREVIRNNDQVTCYLPDDRSVMVDKARPKPIFGQALNLSTLLLAPNYKLSVSDGERIANRETRRIDIEPRDEYRYGYRVSLDKTTSLLLKMELLNEKKEPVEQILFADINISSDIPAVRLKPAITGQGYTWYDEQATTPSDSGERKETWSVGWLPRGFKMSDNEMEHSSSSRMPVEHKAFSDGLSTVSVFIEELKEGDDRLQGVSKMGAINAWGTVLGNYQITAVGEVPVETVKNISQSVIPKVSLRDQ